ncbi:MAG: hypothetical protein LBF64_00885 [Oscillospiraceae bacterium]|jgi:uncharacterized Zn finger protein|nr:hypothetical protein [Oscillospiraceae bacterium]
MSYFGWGEYVPVAKKREQAQKLIAKLKKKNPNLSPVVIEGKKITTTWWGKAWCDNLTSYQDYANRLPRGSAYVKNGYVVDLQINGGDITAKVNGSDLYDIKIKIDPLDEEKWAKIVKKVANRIGSIAELAEGKFSQELADVFMRKGDGLFPSPRQIHMDCDCPDWAGMCKHLAAVMYGVGNRLDSAPLLFFQMRGIDPSELIKKSVDEKMANLLKNSKKRSKRVIKDADIERLFGI